MAQEDRDEPVPSEDEGIFSDLPVVAAAPAGLPGSLELGVFSLSLSVADLDRSRAFYEVLGFEVTGGSADEGWLILKNGETTLGLFSGMFEGNMLTFNPGLTPRMERIESFTDVRDIAERLESAGLELAQRPEPGTEGPASLVVTDPDGNNILVDQFF
ncbi:MAG: VOC family protein [Microthrixaceae bacterium]